MMVTLVVKRLRTAYKIFDSCRGFYTQNNFLKNEIVNDLKVPSAAF